MQFVDEKAVIQQSRKKSLVSIPDSIDSRVFCKKTDAESRDYLDKNVFAKLWNNQHPLIHTWLILTSASIFFLSAFLFVIQ